jgi:membrane-associated protease RseP (regulator of RpoE activity)
LETAAEPLERLLLAGRVRDALAGLMDVESYAWDDRGALTLRGRLTGPAQSLYSAIRSRVEDVGYTPFLRRGAGQDELLAIPGVIARSKPRLGLPIALFVITFLTVLMQGALYDRTDIRTEADLGRAVTEMIRNPLLLLNGMPFAATLIGILFTHEMGHYIVGRLRRAPVSLPYFIPIPPGISFTGTMGAVIVQREPMQDRRTVLEIGIAGPLAGLVVAIPLLFYGLATSTVGPPPASGYAQEGNSLLYGAMKWLVFGQFLPTVDASGQRIDVQLNSMAMAAWIGLLVTMLNLLPVGQLDGGHVAYALFGDRAKYLAYGMIALCIGLGLAIPDNYSWLVWAVLIFLIGPSHPAPLNDIPQLGLGHRMLAVFGLIVFLLLLMPVPLQIVAPQA